MLHYDSYIIIIHPILYRHDWSFNIEADNGGHRYCDAPISHQKIADFHSLNTDNYLELSIDCVILQVFIMTIYGFTSDVRAIIVIMLDFSADPHMPLAALFRLCNIFVVGWVESTNIEFRLRSALFRFDSQLTTQIDCKVDCEHYASSIYILQPHPVLHTVIGIRIYFITFIIIYLMMTYYHYPDVNVLLLSDY